MSDPVDHGAAILAWLASAERYLILEGDSAKVALSIPDASIDAIVADPPAGIAFMGKAWDGDKGGKEHWIAWLAGILAEAFRVLKPGGHMLLWALPRTSHWTAEAGEQAGFEIRDVIVHLFGCLSEDTEILVDGEWVHYQKAAVGRLALCYDVDRDEYFWGPIQETFEYLYADTAYRIRSAGTDQIVSRGHRCIVERDGAFGFERAEDLAREHSARVPVLEGLPDLLHDLPVPHEGRGREESNVLFGVQEHVNAHHEEAAKAEAFSDVRNVRRGVSTEEQSCSEQSQVLLVQVRGGGPDEQARSGGATSRDSADGARGVDRGEPRELRAQDARGEQPSLERRSHLSQSARELRGDEVRSMPGGVSEHGAQGWVRDGAPPRGCAGDGPRVDPSGNRSPHGPQPDEQRDRESGPLCDEPRSQAVRGARYTRTDLATIEPVRYDGTVWCVRVPTGAFVARRNGKVFVTGNSGFPKSLNVSKAIDAAAGATPISTGEFKRASIQRNGSGDTWDAGAFASHPESTKRVEITAPATPDARTWDGWGTALKPASEHWILFRKPLAGTIAANVLAHGTGALNIDAARVGTSKSVPASAPKDRVNFSKGAEKGRTMDTPGFDPNVGRFPANLVLSHTAWEETHCRPCGAVLSFVARFCPECGSGDVEYRRRGCREVGERSVKGSLPASGPTVNGASSIGPTGLGKGRDSIACHAAPDGIETVTAWECLATCACGLSTLAPSGGAAPRCRCGRAMAWACAVARLDEQSGETVSGGVPPSRKGMGYMGGAIGNEAPSGVEGSTGNASRFFNTFAPPDDVEPFFWQAKPSAAETEAGCEALPLKSAAEVTDREEGSAGAKHARAGAVHSGRHNHHPTRKSIKLMRHFCRLVCPPGGIVLDMFAGSGTTIGAWQLEGGRAIGIEMDPEFVAIARARAAFWGRLAGTKAATMAKPRPVREKTTTGQGTLF